MSQKRRTVKREVHVSGGEPGAVGEVFRVAGTPPVLQAKSRAFFLKHRQAREGQARRYRAMSGPLIGLGAIASVLALAGALFGHETALFGLLIGLPALIGGLMTRISAQGLEANPEVAPEAQELLKALHSDFHGKGVVHLLLDLREASKAVKEERAATSPYSGAAKRYYRHRWFRLSGVLVDGSRFALESTTLEKTKSGSTIRKTLQVRGRMALRGDGFEGERRFGNLTARCVKGDRAEVLFWGVTGDMDDLIPALVELGRAVAAA